MLVNADIKSLELVVAAQLANDAVLRREIIDKLDTHANNQAIFKLPTRVVAKRFVFKLLYGASAYGYYTDGDFRDVGYTQNQWQEVIDAFYTKYTGIAEWHQWLDYEAKTTGKLVIPSGRYYPFEYEQTKWGLKWPSTKVKNYPVQGFGADLVMLSRLEFAKRLRESGLFALLISTIHDSIVVDTLEENVYNISILLKESIEHVPTLCKEIWNYDFTLPLTCEVSAGMNKKDMTLVL